MRLSVYILGALVLAGCAGGGESVVSGIANSGNYFGEEDELSMLARAIARDPGTPDISNEELTATFGALRAKAEEGDPSAALVVYRVAAYQRAEALAMLPDN